MSPLSREKKSPLLDVMYPISIPFSLNKFLREEKEEEGTTLGK